MSLKIEEDSDLGTTLTNKGKDTIYIGNAGAPQNSRIKLDPGESVRFFGKEWTKVKGKLTAVKGKKK